MVVNFVDMYGVVYELFKLIKSLRVTCILKYKSSRRKKLGRYFKMLQQ
jgi:hypothetical protein